MGNVEVANWPFRDCEETGLMLCRIALWDCFGTLSLFSMAMVTKLRGKLEQNSWPILLAPKVETVLNK